MTVKSRRKEPAAFHFEQFTFDIDFDPSKENSHTRMDFRVWLFSFVALLFGSCPISVLFRYCLIGSYQMAALFFYFYVEHGN